MAESEVSVRFTSKEDAALWQSFVKLTSGLNKVKDGAEKTRKAADDVDASLRKFAATEVRLNATPLEEYTAKTARLDAALKANLLTQDQHARASAAASAKLRDAWKAGEVKQIAPAAVAIAGPSDDLKKFADRIKAIQTTPLERVTAEVRKLDAALKAGLLTQQQHATAAKRAQDEYQAELDQTAAKLKTTARAGEQTAGATSASWSRMLGAVGISTAAAGALVAKVFAGIREDADRAAQSVQASFRDVGQLGQIGDAAATKERLTIADEYFSTGAAATLSEARQTVLALSNVGALGDAKLFAQLQRTGLSLNPAEFADRARRLQSTLGESEAGTFPQMMARAFVAAEPINVQPGDLVAAAARSGQAASTLGVKSPELYAATASMIRAKGLEQGGERLASTLDKLTTLEGVAGTGLMDRVASIQAKGLSPADLKKFLGDASAVEAVGILGRDAADIAKRARQIEQAQPQLLTQKISEQMAIPEVRTGVRAAEERNRLALAERQSGIDSLAVDALRDRIVRDIKTGRQGGFFGDVAGQSGREVDAKLAAFGIGAARLVPGADRRIVEGKGPTRGEALRGIIQATPAGAAAAYSVGAIEWVKGLFAGPSSDMGDAAKELKAAADALRSATSERGPARPPRQDWIGAARRDQAVEAR